MKYARDDTDKFHEYGLSIPTRTIYIGSNDGDNEDETSARLAEKAIKNLHILDSQSSNPITVLLNSPGGDEYHGLAIFDAIRQCRSQVTIKVMGHAMSMGGIILQAADPGERLLSQNSRVLIHYGTPIQADEDQHTKDYYKWAAESKRFDRWMEDLFLSKIRERHPKYRREQIQKALMFDTIYSASEAVDLGLADKIIA